MAARARTGAIDVVEGLYVGQIVYSLHRLGVLERLVGGAAAQDLAAELGYDAGRLTATLDYLAERTDLVLRRAAGAYELDPRYARYPALGFHLDKFVGAYAPLLQDFDACLRASNGESSRFDGQAMAEAFGRLDGAGVAANAQVIRDWEADSLIDLGCGTADLLVELASTNPGFRGWGVDANPQTCARASQRVHSAGLAEAVQIVNADVRELANHLDQAGREWVGAVHCRSLLNEFFGSPGEAAQVVADLRDLFPGRVCFVSDYYGKLGLRQDPDGAYAHTLLQDMAQVISGQGVPPADLAGWARVYEDGGARLLHAYEGEANGIAWFIHVLRL